jgi:hypothetical protein
LTTVPAWTANALTVAGTVIATAGFVLTARFFVRYLKARGSLPGDRKEAARAQLRMLASGSTHLIVEGIGVTMLFAGTVMTYKLPAWLVLCGVALTLAAVSSAITLRWAARRLR